MARQPDMHQMPPDPFDEDNKWVDRPDPRVIEERRDSLKSAIHQLPAGALSGGERFYDPSDRATMAFSEDPRDREFARDFLGISADLGTLPEGLSTSEKRLLLNAVDDEVDAITAKDLRKEARDNAEFEDAASGLWPAYALMYPDNAASPQDAGAAIRRLVEASPLSKTQLARLAKERPDDILQMIAIEQENPGYHGGRYGSAYDDQRSRIYSNIGGGGTGISGGSGSARSMSSAREEQPGSVFDAVVRYDDIARRRR